MPVEIVWSPLARARLQQIRAYIAKDKPAATERMATRIVAVVEALRMQPYLGRAAGETGVRELVIGGTPFSALYRLRSKRIVILAIWHGAQNR